MALCTSAPNAQANIAVPVGCRRMRGVGYSTAHAQDAFHGPVGKDDSAQKAILGMVHSTQRGPETRRDAVPENVRRPLPSPGAVLRVCSARAAACLPGRSSSPSSSWAHIMRWQQRASAHRQAGRLRGPPPATIPASHDATSATDGRRRRRAEPPATKARRSR